MTARIPSAGRPGSWPKRCLGYLVATNRRSLPLRTRSARRHVSRSEALRKTFSRPGKSGGSPRRARAARRRGPSLRACREWLHVEDHCRAIERILERDRPGETYNVGTGDERSIEEVADAILAVVGAPASLKTYVPDRPGHDRRYLLDYSKIARELGWEPRVPFAQELRDTVEWYRAHRAWWQPKRDRALADVDESRWNLSARR